MSTSPPIQPLESSPQELSLQPGTISLISLPAEIQARIFCESGGLFFRGLLTCKRLQKCILQHASRLPASTRSLALERFVGASRSGGLRRMSEVLMCDLVGDDDLMAHEEAVLEAVLEWIQAGGGEEGRGERLLGLIRYGLLTASRLEVVGLRAEEMVGEGLGARLRDLANEALAVLRLPATAREGQEGGLLCSRAFEPRKGTDVAWEEYAGGRRQHRLVRDKEDARALCECGGRVFGGLGDGSLLEPHVSRLLCFLLGEIRYQRIDGSYRQGLVDGGGWVMALPGHHRCAHCYC